MPTDYYELLGVRPDATDDEIKKAYRRLARELHPDANPDDQQAHERFKQVSVAYETLRDPERRRRYDAYGPDGARVGAAGDPFGFGGGFGDIFDAFFGAGGGGFASRRSGPARGGDLELVLELDFEEAVFGVRREITLRAPVACGTCEGRGSRPGTTPSTCSGCGGAGEVRRVRQSILGQMVTSSPCPRCGGQGQTIADPCPDCRGEGRRTEEKVYEVDVPAGVEDGMQLRLPSRGAAGPRGGPTGDLYLHVRVRPHDRFRREGQDLVAEVHLTVTQAALGASLDFETLDGHETLVIPPGTQTGRLFELRGRGVPAGRGRARGNLVVRVVVDTPTELTKDQDALLRRLAELRGENVAPADSSFFSRMRSAFK
ncbi:MAG: molecular chaperone DnaJ [Actinobacteria bacterium]|nr:molecular chaperone DnaJ [Actinomycetota bacterium]MBW3649345.1 molecular chaperone DnaJ [Actinomycetota bacterium]